MLTKAASRKRAQRAYPQLPPCQACGSTVNVQRHHPNHEDALSVEFLCQRCHTCADQQYGKWGRGPKRTKVCVVCGGEFTNYTHSRVKTCSRTCLSELGRRNAFKRWRTAQPETEL
jgi:hypothetical protein